MTKNRGASGAVGQRLIKLLVFIYIPAPTAAPLLPHLPHSPLPAPLENPDWGRSGAAGSRFMDDIDSRSDSWGRLSRQLASAVVRAGQSVIEALEAGNGDRATAEKAAHLFRSMVLQVHRRRAGRKCDPNVDLAFRLRGEAKNWRYIYRLAIPGYGDRPPAEKRQLAQNLRQAVRARTMRQLQAPRSAPTNAVAE